jgi:hypothetical protein
VLSSLTLSSALSVQADSQKRDCAISFVTLTRSAFSDFFFDFFLGHDSPAELPHTANCKLSVTGKFQVGQTAKARSDYRVRSHSL